MEISTAPSTIALEYVI